MDQKPVDWEQVVKKRLEQSVSSKEVYRPATALIVPKKQDDPNLVVSSSAKSRVDYYLQKMGSSERAQIWQPPKEASSFLSERKFSETRSSESWTMAPDSGGAFQRLDNIGAILAYNKRENAESFYDMLIEELGDDYYIASDQKLLLSPDEGDRHIVSLEKKPRAECWPEISGMGLADELDVRGTGVRYGVLDSGIAAQHNEFGRKHIPFSYIPIGEASPISDERMGFDPDNHGTHVSSILVGKNVGISPLSKLYSASVLEGESITTTLRRVALGLDWIYGQFTDKQNISKPLILNMSMGFLLNALDKTDPTNYRYSMQSMMAVIENMLDGNVLVFAAIGNDGEDKYRIPAATPEVIGVGAVDQEGLEIMEFSGNVPDHEHNAGLYGPDLLGFGENVIGAISQARDGSHRYERRSGTSQATPYVAGIAGLYWSMDRDLTAEQVRQLLFDTAKPAPAGENPIRWGAGVARFDPPTELIKRFKRNQAS